MKFYVSTLGCKANYSDGQTMEGRLQENGHLPVKNPKEADWIIVNSCSVTDEADKQSERAARKFKRLQPNAKVLFTGCSAEVDPLRFANSKSVDAVVGNQDKSLIHQLIEKFDLESSDKILGKVQPYSELLSRHPMDRDWPTSDSVFYQPNASTQVQTFRTRSFLKIQEGCNSFCTYCIIPYGRGPSRSLSLEKTVAAVQELELSGFKEVVLTATNLGDYQENSLGPLGLASLLKQILRSTQHIRIRLSSLDPIELEAGVLDLLESETRLCAHVHVSLQSTDSDVLRLMKRKYRFKDVSRVLEKLEYISKRRSLFVGMDLITGFPGETSEKFQNSVQFLKKAFWSRLHVFPYSERAKTPATKLAGIVKREERFERSRVLNELSFDRLRTIYTGLIGQKFDSILWESPQQDGRVHGYTQNYIRCSGFPKETDLNSFRVVSVTEHPTAFEMIANVVPDSIPILRSNSLPNSLPTSMPN